MLYHISTIWENRDFLTVHKSHLYVSQLKLLKSKYRSALSKLRKLEISLASDILFPLYSHTGRPAIDPAVLVRLSIPWWRSHPIHKNRATESIWTEPCNPLLRAAKSTKRATFNL